MRLSSVVCNCKCFSFNAHGKQKQKKDDDDDDDDDDGEVKIMFWPKRTTEIIYVCYQKANLSVSCQIFILTNNYLLC